MPFFQALGYDVFNPNELIPEFTADIGTKKGEKVDYAFSKIMTPLSLWNVSKTEPHGRAAMHAPTI